METLDHALGDYLFHKVISAVLKKIWEPLHVQGLLYECGTVPVLHSFGTPQGIAQWSALAARWTLHNTYRKGGMATQEALLTVWIRFTSLLVSWEPLSEFLHVFQIFHDRLIHFKHQGVVTGLGITYVEPVELEERRHSKRRRKDDHKQELAAIALEQIKQAQSRGLSVIYTDGLAGLVGGVGWVAGYGCHEPGLWKKANHLPTHKKQSINRAELMAVIESLRRTSTRRAAFAVATGSTYVYGGVQGAAIPWQAQHWVTTKFPVLNVDLWIDLLELLDVSVATYEWIKVPRHVQLDGNERADALAELGRISSPLYARAGCRPRALLTPVAALPPVDSRRSSSLDTGSAIQHNVEMTPVACDADLSFSRVTPASRGGGAALPLQEVIF